MAKIYVKNTWLDEVLSAAERYDIKDNAGAVVHGNMQIGLLTTVVQAGTAADAAKMNNLESGVDGLDTLIAAAVDGWTPAPGTLVFATATTITVPTGAAAIYSVGDKLRLTQTTVKYFYIVAVADTLLTVTGGSDFTVANATITGASYSHAANPVGFPQLFNWIPVIVGFSTLPTATYRFSISGRTVYFNIAYTVAGTSNATTYTVTFPVSSNAATSFVIPTITDGGANKPAGVLQLLGASGTLYLSAFSAWTNTGTKGASLSGFYEI